MSDVAIIQACWKIVRDSGVQVSCDVCELYHVQCDVYDDLQAFSVIQNVIYVNRQCLLANRCLLFFIMTSTLTIYVYIPPCNNLHYVHFYVYITHTHTHTHTYIHRYTHTFIFKWSSLMSRNILHSVYVYIFFINRLMLPVGAIG